MKHTLNNNILQTGLLFLLLVWMIPLTSYGWGMPFMRNFSADEYHAHTRNFDIITDKDGIVYVANFEGLLYYDHAEWHILHTPGVNRLTAVFCDQSNRVWVGGYNYFGYLQADAMGRLQLHSIVDGINQGFSAEVNWIWQRGREVQLLLSNGKIFAVSSSEKSAVNHHTDNYRLVFKPHEQLPKSGSSTLGVSTNINQVQKLDNNLKAIATNGKGVIITDDEDHFLFDITEENGLCNNNVNHVTYDNRGHLWGATDHGIFCVSIPSVYSHFSTSEGLKGDVLSVIENQGVMFAGTLNGLFVRHGMRFVPVANVNHACWQLVSGNNQLLAATSNGVFRVNASGAAHQINSNNTLSLLITTGGFYSGETDGVFFPSISGARHRVSVLEKVTHIYRNQDGTIWRQNIYGQIWKKTPASQMFKQVVLNGKKNEIATLIIGLNGAEPIPASGGVIPYPQFSYCDPYNVLWLTDNSAKHLYALRHNRRYTAFDAMIRPLTDLVIRAMIRDKNQLWIGGDFGLLTINSQSHDPALENSPVLHIRNVVVNGDSIIWGGFGKQPLKLTTLDSDLRNINFTFSMEQNLLLGRAHFRYRLNDGSWSGWSTDTHAEFLQLYYGSYTFEVQGRDAAGRLSQVVSMSFRIQYPVFLRWYAILLYLAIFSFIVFQLIKWRMHRLVKEKARLEKLLRETQGELIQQVKLASIGKLTQGLIDRILNPMNYICNFSKLSIGLAKDLDANLEDEHEHISEDNYEDSKDILKMLNQNMSKVEEHGQSTTRTLKMMEEMLEDRSGGKVQLDILQLLRDQFKLLQDEQQSIIEKLHIQTEMSCPEGEVHLKANPELLAKVIKSMLSNAIYALDKKVKGMNTSQSTDSSVAGDNTATYIPLIRMTAEIQDKKLLIHIYDNGIGIGDNIIDKIFDPFFTTKTTAEAAGVGLYLSRDVIQGIGGDISLESVKGEHTEFTILIPIRNA